MIYYSTQPTIYNVYKIGREDFFHKENSLPRIGESWIEFLKVAYKVKVIPKKNHKFFFADTFFV